MRFDPSYQNQYMAYPVNREQDGYAMHGYAPPPPGECFPYPFLYPFRFWRMCTLLLTPGPPR